MGYVGQLLRLLQGIGRGADTGGAVNALGTAPAIWILGPGQPSCSLARPRRSPAETSRCPTVATGSTSGGVRHRWKNATG